MHHHQIICFNISYVKHKKTEPSDSIDHQKHRYGSSRNQHVFSLNFSTTWDMVKVIISINMTILQGPLATLNTHSQTKSTYHTIHLLHCANPIRFSSSSHCLYSSFQDSPHQGLPLPSESNTTLQGHDVELKWFMATKRGPLGTKTYSVTDVYIVYT